MDKTFRAIDAGKAVQLCTFYWGKPVYPPDHPLQYDFIITISTRNVSIDAGRGRIVSFSPGLIEPVSLTRSISRIDARAEIASANLHLWGVSFTNKAFYDSGGSGWRVRIDYGYDGASLSELVPIFDGYIDEINITPGVHDILRITAVEGLGKVGIEFPGAKFSFAEFPHAPHWVVDSLARTVIIGPVPEMVMCVPISADGRTYYICEPPLTIPPRAVYVGHTRTQNYKIETFRTAVTGVPFSAVVFPKPVYDVTREFSTIVSVSGGYGVSYTDPVSFLASYIGLQLSGRAKYLSSLLKGDFPLSIMVNESTDVLSLIMERIMRQTPYLATFFLSMLDVIDLSYTDLNMPVMDLSYGSGLVGYASDSSKSSSFGSVVNSVEIKAGMTHYGNGSSSLPIMRILFDAYNGPREIRAIAAASQAIYGRRFLSVDAPDLYVEVNESGIPIRSKSAEKLAAFIIRSRAFQAVTYSYFVNSYVAFRSRLGDMFLLTDEFLGLRRQPVMLSGINVGKEVICEFEKITY